MTAAAHFNVVVVVVVVVSPFFPTGLSLKNIIFFLFCQESPPSFSGHRRESRIVCECVVTRLWLIYISVKEKCTFGFYLGFRMGERACDSFQKFVLLLAPRRAAGWRGDRLTFYRRMWPTNRICRSDGQALESAALSPPQLVHWEKN